MATLKLDYRENEMCTTPEQLNLNMQSLALSKIHKDFFISLFKEYNATHSENDISFHQIRNAFAWKPGIYGEQILGFLEYIQKELIFDINLNYIWKQVHHILTWSDIEKNVEWETHSDIKNFLGVILKYCEIIQKNINTAQEAKKEKINQDKDNNTITKLGKIRILATEKSKHLTYHDLAQIFKTTVSEDYYNKLLLSENFTESISWLCELFATRNIRNEHKKSIWLFIQWRQWLSDYWVEKIAKQMIHIYNQTSSQNNHCSPYVKTFLWIK